MSQINPDIISEIKGLADTSQEMKDYLLWIVDFERGNMDKDHVIKQPIQDELKRIIAQRSGAHVEGTADGKKIKQ